MAEFSEQPDTPEGTILAYVDACRAANGDRLKDLFHPKAMMSGYFEGDFYFGLPDPFYDEVKDNPLPPDSVYTAEVTASAVYGNIAHVELRERGYLGEYNLTNLFQLVLEDGSWSIVGKCYTDHIT